MRWPHETHKSAAGDEASGLQLEVDENQTLMVLGFSTDAMQSMIDDAEVDGCQWRLKQMRMTMNIWHCIVNALQDDAPCFDELLIVDVVEHRDIGSINHLYSKVSTISGHLQHLEGHLLGISSWSISNISCSSCWNISSNIKSIFSKTAGASSVDASQMQIIEAIVDQEEHQIIEDDQPAEGEAASPSPERPSSAKPPKSTIKSEQEAKIHIVDTIIYNILASDSTYHTPPSESIRIIYDSFSVILAEGVDITTAMGTTISSPLSST